MGLAQRELGSNATAGVTEALIERFSKLTRPPDREILRAVDREETDAGNARPSESHKNRNRYLAAGMLTPSRKSRIEVEATDQA